MVQQLFSNIRKNTFLKECFENEFFKRFIAHFYHFDRKFAREFKVIFKITFEKKNVVQLGIKMSWVEKNRKINNRGGGMTIWDARVHQTALSS